MASSRIFPRISLKDFESRKEEVTKQLVDAATGVGFFIIADHGIPPEQISHMFQLSQKYFALPDGTKINHYYSWYTPNSLYLDAKSKNAFVREKNVGWESKLRSGHRPALPTRKKVCSFNLAKRTWRVNGLPMKICPGSRTMRWISC